MAFACAGESIEGSSELVSRVLPFAGNYFRQQFVNYGLKRAVEKASHSERLNNLTSCFLDEDWREIKYWIEKGADPNSNALGLDSSTRGGPIIFEAIREGREDLVEFLIQKGGRVDIPDQFGRYPMYFTMKMYVDLPHHQSSKYRIMEMLLTNGAKPDSVMTPFSYTTPFESAARRRNIDHVRLLLSYGADATKGLLYAFDRPFSLRGEERKIILSLVEELTQAGALWDFKSFNNNYRSTFLQHLIWCDCHLTKKDIIEILKHAPIYFLLKKNLETDPFLKQLLPLNEILPNSRADDVKVKCPAVIDFLEETVLNLKELLAVPRISGMTLLQELNSRLLLAECAEDFRELLDGSKLDDDYKKFIGAARIDLLPQDNIVKGMYYNTVKFLEKYFPNISVD